MDAIIGTGNISKREYEIKAERNTTLIMSDGITLIYEYPRYNLYINTFNGSKSIWLV